MLAVPRVIQLELMQREELLSRACLGGKKKAVSLQTSSRQRLCSNDNSWTKTQRTVGFFSKNYDKRVSKIYVLPRRASAKTRKY